MCSQVNSLFQYGMQYLDQMSHVIQILHAIFFSELSPMSLNADSVSLGTQTLVKLGAMANVGISLWDSTVKYTEV